MLDNPFRRILPAYVDVILTIFSRLNLSPNHITWLAFLLSVGAAALTMANEYVFAVAIWWISRLLDACDGIYARKFNRTSKLGAFLDIQLDMAAYSLMVLSFFWVFPEYSLQWVLMLFFYVLCIAGALSLGNLENQAQIPEKSGRGLRLATGLAEGGETGIAYTVFLVFPEWLPVSTWVWILILSVTVIARGLLAYKELRGN
jgi:phosphatidylglycerophosphate synthase